MKPTESEIKDASTLWADDYHHLDQKVAKESHYEGAQWAISQMQPELTTLKRHDEQLRIWINTMTYEIKVLKTALKDTLEFSRDEQLSEWLFDQDYHTQVIIEEKTGCDSLPQPPKDIKS